MMNQKLLRKNCKAELTTQQIVGLVILITSFAVILFLLFRLNLGETTDKQICHNSVVMKGKSVLGGALDCKTNYVCISGGGECDGINPTITVDIEMNPKAKDEEEKNEKIKNQIMKVIADEMADCWWMFGEGKIDYMGLSAKSVTIGKMNCALCSIISFDKEIQNFGKEDKNKFDYEWFYESYLRTTKKENSNTYLNYLYNTHNFKDVEGMIKINKDEFFEFRNQYVILTGIAEQGFLKQTGSFFLSGFDFFNQVFVSFLNLPKIADYNNYGPIPIVVKNKEELSDLGCDEFITKA